MARSSLWNSGVYIIQDTMMLVDKSTIYNPVKLLLIVMSLQGEFDATSSGFEFHLKDLLESSNE